MKFNNVYEEEYFFPYEGLSLEENREIRYLLSNSFDFLDGDIVQMRLIKNEETIIANGMYGGYNGNKTFVSKIIKTKDGYNIESKIYDLSNKCDQVSNTFFIYDSDNVKVISSGKSRIIKRRSNVESINR